MNPFHGNHKAMATATAENGLQIDLQHYHKSNKLNQMKALEHQASTKENIQ